MANKKLTNDQIQQVLQLYQDNVSATKIAKQFQVSTTTITSALTRAGMSLRSRSETQTIFREQFRASGKHSAYREQLGKRHRGKVVSQASREKMSKSRALGIANGTIDSRCYGKAQWYEGFYCRSSWEVAFIKLALSKNWDIQPCKVVIPYYYKGITRNYIPDFMSAQTGRFMR